MKVLRINVSSLIILGISLLCGCQKESPDSNDGLHEMTFHAGWTTKTVLQSDGSIYWSPGDKISIFMEGGASTGYEFVSTNKSESASTTFKGTLDGFASKYYALYPYDQNATCESGTITATIPSEQTAIEGTFPNGALLSVAATSDKNLFFKNACSGIKFSVLHDNINRIVVKSQQPLAGGVNIPTSDIDNIAPANSGAVNTVTVTAPSDGCFKTSSFYYLTLCPGIHQNGIEVEYYNGNDIIAIASIPGPVDFTRAIVNRLYEKDIIYATSITLDKESASLKVGETVTLTATITPDDVTDKTVTWTSSDESVAVVADGVVTAKKIGTTTITAKAGEKTAVCQVSVVATEVSSITLDRESATLKAGETVTLIATVKPDDATDKAVTWTTSDESVATVQDGIVTAKKVGTATITAKAGDKTAACAITVVATPVTSVTLDKTSESLMAGETVTLTATVKPDDATDKTVTWTTSDATVATVDNGVVTAVKVGSATITAMAGDMTATCAITVVPTPVTSVTLDKTSAQLKAGETVTLTATVNPDDATDKTVTWITSDTSVATVDNGVVTAKKVGTATITAKAGDKSATCAITVVPTPVISVTLDKTSAQLKVGETVTLTATVKPDDATDKTVTWTTSDASVATVNNGVVTAVKVGSATITATAGDQSATCTINVSASGSHEGVDEEDWEVAVTSVTLDITSASLEAGQSVTLTATVMPNDATDKTVTWSTSDANVATVRYGVVTAKKVGTATITAKAGDVTATCVITVVPTPVTSVTLNQTTASLKVDETVTLTATVNPSNATDKTVTWSTSDASVATVSNGVVTAINAGTATITAKAGDKTATCVVTVSPIEATSLTLDKTSVTMKVGESTTLKATVTPSNAALTWKSSNSDVATVYNGVVTALKSGEAIITVLSGEKSAQCTVQVSDSSTGIGDWEIGDNSNGSI